MAAEGAGGRAGAAPGSAATTGLSAAEVAARRAAGQTNEVVARTGRTVAQIVRANVLTRFNAILGGLLVVVAFVGPVQDGLFGVVLVSNVAIGVVQEVRAMRVLDRLAVLSAPRARVVRDGRRIEVPTGEIVLDDVIALRPGDQVPADGEVLAGDGLEVDEALVTGEAEPVAKAAGDTVLSGTFVVAGDGSVRATAVGPHAFARSLEAGARRFVAVRSELQDGTNRLLRLVTFVMVPAGIALVASQLLRTHQSLAEALRGAVAGVGAMVPEGLVLLTSIAFAVGALRLARARVLVQELPAIEGLAHVDMVCVDKTGTLTAPGMHLVSVEPLDTAGADDVAEVAAAMAAADPAPNATLAAIAGGREPPPWSCTDRVPFSSARKWSAATFAGKGTWVIGAPEALLPAGAAAAGRVALLQEAGRRVVLLASAPVPAGADLDPATLAPEALLVLAEQLRDETAATIGALLAQDIAVTVLSGDAPATVAAVAREAGIPVRGEPGDATGLDGPGLAAALRRTNVLGRIRPEQKLEAVRALQHAGHVVAMVGDGVNDLAALKEADLGIAMGSGSAASRAVARLVLLGDSFGPLPRVLDEGRRVVANVTRVANLFVTKTVYASLLAVVVAVGGVAYPFYPRHLTVVSSLTIGIPGFFLALAPGAPRARAGFVRRVLTFTVPAGAGCALATLVTYGVGRAAGSVPADQVRTASMLALFGAGLWVLALVARPLDGWRVGLVVAMGAGLVLLFGVPLGRHVFDLAVPPAWLVVVAVVSDAGGIAVGAAGIGWARRTGVGRRSLATGDGPGDAGKGGQAP
jgi:cation-transporting ATPase E